MLRIRRRPLDDLAHAQALARSASSRGDIPAAALTAYAKIHDRVSILAAGLQMYLSKPADPSELIAVVASLAARRRRVPTEGLEPPASPK